MPENYQTVKGFGTEEWPEYFHMPVLMLMLITLLNDGTLIAIGYDNVIPNNEPDKWNIGCLFTIGFVLAFVAFISSILLLWALLDSWNEDSLFQVWGLGGLTFGQIITAIYLKVSVSDFLTLFSARTGEHFFWNSRPANILLGAAAIALSTSTILAMTWPDSRPDDIETEGLVRRKPYALFFYIILYCIFWWFVQDLAKVLVWRYMKKNNTFGIMDSGKCVVSPAMREKVLREMADDF